MTPNHRSNSAGRGITARAPPGQQFRHRPKSPQNPHGKHAGGQGRLHVDGRIAHVQKAVRGQVHDGGDLQRRGRIGLARHPVPLAQHRLEREPGKVLADTGLGEHVGLVREHRQPHVARHQFRQQLVDPVVGMCLDVPAFRVRLAEIFRTGGQYLVAASLARQRPLEQHAHTLADELAIGIQGMRGKVDAGPGRDSQPRQCRPACRAGCRRDRR